MNEDKRTIDKRDIVIVIKPCDPSDKTKTKTKTKARVKTIVKATSIISLVVVVGLGLIALGHAQKGFAEKRIEKSKQDFMSLVQYGPSHYADHNACNVATWNLAALHLIIWKDVKSYKSMSIFANHIDDRRYVVKFLERHPTFYGDMKSVETHMDSAFTLTDLIGKDSSIDEAYETTKLDCDNARKYPWAPENKSGLPRYRN